MAAFHQPLPALQQQWLAGVAQLVAQGASIRAFLSRLLPYAKPYPRHIVEILAYLLFAIGFGMALQLSTKFLIDNVLAPQGTSRCSLRCWAPCSSHSLSTRSRACGGHTLTAWVGEKILIQLRLDTFLTLQKLSAGFYSRARVGDIVSRMSNDLQIVQQALSSALLSGLYYIFSFVLALIAIFLLDWRLSCAVVATLPLLFIAEQGSQLAGYHGRARPLGAPG